MNRCGLPAYALRDALRRRPRMGLLSTFGGGLAEADAVLGNAEQAEPLHLAEFARRQTLAHEQPERRRVPDAVVRDVGVVACYTVPSALMVT